MIITIGNHPWNIHPTRKGERRECPECRSNEIKNNICLKCGYSPKKQSGDFCPKSTNGKHSFFDYTYWGSTHPKCAACGYEDKTRELDKKA
jgi:hypothetical protein